jgi:hypothetical protein
LANTRRKRKRVVEEGVKYRVVPFLGGAKANGKYDVNRGSIEDFDSLQDAEDKAESFRGQWFTTGRWYTKVIIFKSPCPGLPPSIIHSEIKFKKPKQRKRGETRATIDYLITSKREWKPSTIWVDYPNKSWRKK